MEQSCIQKIKDLYTYYSGDEFAESKIHEFITVVLPSKIDAIVVDKFKREVRREHLCCISNKFIQAFLSDKQQYFYIPNTDTYVCYNGVTYTTISIDSILHAVLKSIKLPINKELVQWKYKIKTHIMKLIKERNLLKNIPESVTIQNVISMLTSTICVDKPHAKHLLTVIGDNVLGKINNNYYFINEEFKPFMHTIVSMTFAIFKCAFNPVSRFKYRFNYAYHKTDTARVMHFVSPGCLNIWRSLMKTHFLDFINVAAHYSVRFGSADASLQSPLKEKVFYLRERGIDTIIQEFIEDNLDVTKCDDDTIDIKRMYCIWKSYLRENEIPIILNSVELTDKIGNFNVESGLFMGIKCKRNKLISRFIDFWKTTIVDDVEETFLEVGELYTLFVEWSKYNELNEDELIDIIKDFGVDLIDNKYMDGKKCILWDKRGDVMRFINTISSDGYIDNEDVKVVYKKYCMWCKAQTPNAKIVSINYFRNI